MSKRGKPGPEPETLKVDRDDWEDAVKEALDKKRPPTGWPKPEKPPKLKRRKGR